MSLPAKLTVLAGCETAGGRMTTGEGILGLTSAFMSAGVPVVVSSLWSIDDRATARVMRSFYAHLARRETVATSLRLAQMEMRRTRGYAHPFYWAGFTVVGDGALSVQVERKSPVRAILSLLVVILAVVSLAVWAGRNRRRAGDLHSSENRV
jgi:predicted kinase